MKLARCTIPVFLVGYILLAGAPAQGAEQKGGSRGRTLLQMIDTLYGDFLRCRDVPRMAASSIDSPNAKNEPWVVLMPSPLRPAYISDGAKAQELPAGQEKLVRPAVTIAYVLLALLISIALSSIFLWFGASMAGLKQANTKDNFLKALMCSVVDRLVVGGVLVLVTFGLGKLIGRENLLNNMGIISAFLMVGVFILSIYIVKVVYGTKWHKAFLIQCCARVAVVMVAVFVLGLATTISLSAAA